MALHHIHGLLPVAILTVEIIVTFLCTYLAAREVRNSYFLAELEIDYNYQDSLHKPADNNDDEHSIFPSP